MELTCKAKKKDGRLKFLYPDHVLYDINRFFKDGELEVIIRTPRSNRSSNQNRYYWGVMIPMIMDGLKDIGYLYDRHECHEMMKLKFLSEDVIVDGETIIKGSQSTAKLSNVEFKDYISLCKDWAFKYLSIDIPLPGEQTDIFFK